jgi:hypothetical protein
MVFIFYLLESFSEQSFSTKYWKKWETKERDFGRFCMILAKS